MNIFESATRVGNPYALAAFAIACVATVAYVWFKWGRYATERKAMSRAKGDSLVQLAYAFGQKYALPTDRLKAKDVVLLVQQHVNSQEKRSFRLACLAAVTLVVIVLPISILTILAQQNYLVPYKNDSTSVLSTKKPFTPVVPGVFEKMIFDVDNNKKYLVWIFYRNERQDDAEHIVGGLLKAGYQSQWLEETQEGVVARDKRSGTTLIKTTADARPTAEDVANLVKLAIPLNAQFVSVFPDNTKFQREGDIQIDLF